MRIPGERLAREQLRRACAVVATLAVAAAPGIARGADDSPYCRKVRARAKSDAALLLAPSLRLEGIRIPVAFQRANAGGDASLVGPQYQLRAGLTVSPLSMWKGLQVLDVGAADCAQFVSAEVAQEVLQQDKDYGRLPAITKQIAYLDEQRASWQALEKTGEERFASNVTTLQQVEEIRVRTMNLERHRAQLEGEKNRLEKAGIKPFHGKLADIARAVEGTAMEYERKASSVRKLDAWGASVTAGYVPPLLGVERSDFFGMVQLTHNFGGIFRNAAETSYLEARKDELKNERYELSARISAFRTSLRTVEEQAQKELQVLDARTSALRAGRAALEGAEAGKAAHALALLDLELISAESERIYLTELLNQLRNIEDT